MIDNANLIVRVKAGALLLDQQRPGWAADIKPNRLAIHTCYRCVLGQIYGHYSNGCRDLFGARAGETWEKSASFGFTIRKNATATEQVPEFRLLAKLWRSEVRSRLAADAGGTPA